MITALKLKRAIMKEAEKKHLNVECFLKNSTLRGINEGAYGHVINISSVPLSIFKKTFLS